MAGKGLFPNLFKAKDSLIKQAVSSEAQDRRADITANDPLEKFASEIKGPSSGFIRYVLKMSTSTFQSQFLKSGGGSDFITNLSDEEVEDIANDIHEPEDLGDATIVAFSKGYPFTDLLTGSAEVAVLLDIPTNISSELEVAKMNPKKARDALLKMMNHKYYVMSIYISKAKKISQQVTKYWDDIEDLTRVLNPAIILNYPVASERARMMDAYARVGTNSVDDQTGTAAIEGVSVEDLQAAYKVLKVFSGRLGARGTISEMMKIVSNMIAGKK